MDTEQPTTPWGRYMDPERKRKFAALARVRPDTDSGRFEAACLTFPDDGDDALALKAAQEYPFDRVCIEEKARLEAAEPAEALPTKAQQARDIYNLATGAKTISDKLAAHKLYAEVMGFVQKPGVTANTYVDNRRVMVMPPPANSIEEWEADAVSHQARLIEHASR